MKTPYGVKGAIVDYQSLLMGNGQAGRLGWRNEPDQMDLGGYPKTVSDGPRRSPSGSGVNYEKGHTCKYVSMCC